MTSRKRSARAKRVAEFKASLSDDRTTWEKVEKRETARARNKAAALEKKMCTSKKRYSSKYEAEATANECAEYGAPKLSTYRCPICNGWHLTSKPQ